MIILLIILAIVLLYALHNRGHSIKEIITDIRYLPNDTRLNLQRYYKRALNGWAPEDTWAIDTWTSEILPSMLRYLADSTHSYPLDCKSLLQWQNELREMAKNIEAYHTWDNSNQAFELGETDIEQYQAQDEYAARRTKEGLRQFSERIFDLWD